MTAIAHADRAHALLSASSSHRWLHCTPSARLEETLPDSESEAAKRGTLAHEMAELKLRKHFVDPMGPRKFNAAMKKFKAEPLYESVMDEHTSAYLEYIQAIVHAFPTPPHIAIEQRVNYSHIAPEGFGTADCTIIGSGRLHIIDYKNGSGVPVSAEDNPQMKLYALGALAKYGFLYPIDVIHVAIVQPKVWDKPSEWSISVADLIAWGESIKPVADLAWRGEGEFVIGDHCGFCRAKTTCRARVEQLLSVEEHQAKKPPLISWEEVADVLRRAEGIVKWYEAIKKAALAHALQGGELPGWKAVEGRGGREYTNLDAAFSHLKANGIEEAVLYERKPITPPALEELLGKADYRKLLEDPGHVTKHPGKPTLAPAGDKRPAVSNQVKPADVFSAPTDA
ncbi:DUF2800 domain-containing protein [Paenibacillus pasadenensis]|uniref:DUF2800 domain-containing protein n=1 Tax=Paenibacillus pasadenensis TaxID=217090 RepID=UPI00203C551B|nr:DUF2800 domain-containing protein [Paenibacillus pasadenensis]MCM3747426.1 DUF2800 domain-containing protein [Paenibacillus pasadenensis]